MCIRDRGGILPRGGTILRTSRTNPNKREGGLQRCAENLKKHGCDALIAIGGDDTLSVAKKLFDNGVRVVGDVYKRQCDFRASRGGPTRG